MKSFWPQLFALLAVFTVAQASAQVEALLVADTNAKDIGKVVAQNLKNVKGALESSMGKDVNITVLEGKEVSTKNIDTWLSKNTKGRRFVYISTHGTWETKEGHLFAFANGDRLNRTTLRYGLSARDRNRNFVLITESCGNVINRNIHIVFRPAPAPDYDWLKRAVDGGTETIDVNSSSRDQLSWGLDNIGGFFTTSFLESVQTGAKERKTWDEIIDGSQKQIDGFLKSSFEKDVPKQVPMKFHNDMAKWDVYTQAGFALKNFDPKETRRVRINIVTGNAPGGRALPNPETLIMNVGPSREVTVPLAGSDNEPVVGTRATIEVQNGKEWGPAQTIDLVSPTWGGYLATGRATVTHSFPAVLIPFPGRDEEKK